MKLNRKKGRNPNDFTIDEVKTATLIYTEGTFACDSTGRGKYRRYYPAVRIRMCVKEGLEPALRVFKTSIFPVRLKEVQCPPEVFPPDGKGHYQITIRGHPAERIMERLKPLIPAYYWRKWEMKKEECIRKRPPTRPYIRRKYE